MGFFFYVTIHKLQEIINNITKIKQKTNKNTLATLKGGRVTITLSRDNAVSLRVLFNLEKRI